MRNIKIENYIEYSSFLTFENSQIVGMPVYRSLYLHRRNSVRL